MRKWVWKLELTQLVRAERALTQHCLTTKHILFIVRVFTLNDLDFPIRLRGTFVEIQRGKPKANWADPQLHQWNTLPWKGNRMKQDILQKAVIKDAWCPSRALDRPSVDIWMPRSQLPPSSAGSSQISFDPWAFMTVTGTTSEGGILQTAKLVEML